MNPYMPSNSQPPHFDGNGYDRSVGMRSAGLPPDRRGDPRRNESLMMAERARYGNPVMQDSRPMVDHRVNYDSRAGVNPTDRLNEPIVRHGIQMGDRGMERSLHNDQRAMMESRQYDPRFNMSATNSGPLPMAPSSVNNLSSNSVNPIIGPSRTKVSLPPHPPNFPRPSVTEIVLIPGELAAFAADPKFQQILLRVKEQTYVNFIVVNRLSDEFVESVTIDAPSREAAQLARNLVETHLKLQLKVKAAETRLLRVQTDLFSTQGEIASGQMVEFIVPSELIGLIIGKKGARIKQIESETGVTSINVRDNGQITIYGKDSPSVQRAKELLELREDSFPLTAQQAEWLSNKNNAGIIGDMKASAELMVAKVNREKNTLDVVGVSSSVVMARCLLETQLEYVEKQIEIENSEREAREKLLAVRKQYGINYSGGWKGKGKGGPDYGVELESRPVGNNNPGPSEQGNKVKVEASESNPKGRNVKAGYREVTITNPPSSLVLDSKNSTSQAVEDALDALITSTPAESSQRQSSNLPQENKKSNKKKNKDRNMMVDSVVASKDSTENLFAPAGSNEDKDVDMPVLQANNKNNKRKGRQQNQSPVLMQPAFNMASAENQRQEQAGNDTSKQEKGGKGKQPRDKEKGGKDGGSGSLMVIPPPPALVVPSSPSGKNDRSAKKNDKRNDGKNNAAVAASTGSNSASVTKQSMLVKINIPYLEQQARRAAAAEKEALVVDLPLPPTKSSGPPKKPLSLVSMQDNTQSKPALTPANSEGADSGDGTGDGDGSNGRQKNRNNRRRRDHADLLKEVKVIGVESADKELAATLSHIALDEKKVGNSDSAKPGKEQAFVDADVVQSNDISDIPLPPRHKKGPPGKASAISVSILSATTTTQPPSIPPPGLPVPTVSEGSSSRDEAHTSQT